MHIFGIGPGHLSAKVAKIAKEHDAELVNHTDPQCQCGHGCQPYNCKRSRRHWFTTQNLSEPYNSRTAREVLDAVRAIPLERI